jgi:hypothetical protein
MGSGITCLNRQQINSQHEEHDKELDSVVSNVKVESFIKGFLSTGNIRECLCKLWSSGCKEKFVTFIQMEVPKNMGLELIQVRLSFCSIM